MKSDIQIAQAAKLKPISEIANLLDIPSQGLLPYGHHIAKISQSYLSQLDTQKQGKLILVTAINPTPAGEGKTTTSIGLTDALHALGKRSLACLREPSLGPVFGMKGGATGGGYAQVVPMENINLHFTGDFHAIGAANNLLAALVDNHIHHGNTLDIVDVTWRRCVDMNDRALRRVKLEDNEAETGFDITVASEVMAIFCLAESLQELSERLGEIQVGVNSQGQAVLAKDLQAQGAMTALLKDAFQPNLVQTMAGAPAIIHGGPFANIAHGCNSVVATKSALKMADYVVTEAGFGADLGAEKFFDIKCRLSHLKPDVVVLVATVRALKYHGGAELAEINDEGLEYLSKGINNLKKHIHNLHEEFGMQVVVAINRFTQDTAAEIAMLENEMANLNIPVSMCEHWAKGAAGALDLAQTVVATLQEKASAFQLLYPNSMPLKDKLLTIAQRIYSAKDVACSELAQTQLTALQEAYGHLPICVAKTQYSLSSDPSLRNHPQGHTLEVKSLRLSRGAGFIVAICGPIMTMPGLPKQPASERINVNAKGEITGLS